ncbi:hypothetical protein [Nonomuraea sp. LPB2021202275-12-8]|uniref:hypothetical protein n=1 Tax=Nonomuraea sp. LPB2021202275-12-8 TaxID=3120159 RepID=UPI00300CEF33
MKNSSRAGAAALIAAGILIVGANSALAAEPQSKAERIISAEDLRQNVLQAVALERQNGGAELSACTGGKQPR